MNLENKIRKDLLSKRRRDLHIRFFQQNPSLSSVKVPILSPIDSTKCLIPFRNTNCTEPDCVHDLQDLINMCKSFNYKFPKGFNCRTCNMYIEFKNFFLDEYLKNIIDSIWESHNSYNKVVYDSIIIRRNGSWQPVPTGKLANPNTNSIDQPQMMTNRTSDTKKYGQTRTSLEYTTMTTWRDDRTVTEGEKPVTIVNYENPPHLCEYNQVEYEQLLSAFERGSLEDSVILRRDDAIVTRDDLKKLEHDEIVTSQTMSMFVWYLNVLQKVHGKIYNKKNNCYVTAFKVCSFDQFKKQVRYNTISSSLEFQGKHHEACNTYDKITILLSIEQRWVVAVLDLIERRLVLVDFLQDDLSRMKAPEMLEIIKYLVRAEFQFTYNEVKLYDVPKLSFISDCGLYALSFVYKCISNPVLDNIRIKFYEKELFRKQIVWLLLKMRTLKKTEVHLFMAPENSSREPNNKTSTFTRQAFEDSLLMRMPSIPSEQVSTLPRFHAKSCNNLLPEALAAARARVNSKNDLKMMLDVKPASDSEAIVRPERAKPVSNQPQFNLGINNRQVVSHWNLREESNSLNSLRAKRGSMLLQGDYKYKRSLQDLDKPRSQDNSLLKPASTRTQEIKEKIMTKRKQVMSLNNLDAIETSDIKRKDLQSILSDFKKDILDAIKQEHEAQRKSETQRISLLNRESENRKAFPPLRHDYKSLSELMDEDLPDPRLFMPRKQGNVGFIGLPKNHLASDDESLGGSDDEDDDMEGSEESSPSIVLFGFQEENESPKRLDLEAKDESNKKQQRVEEGGYEGFKKGLEKEYNEEEEGGLFDYSPDIVKSVAISEKRQGANEYNRDLHEIREHGHDEEESPF